MCRLREALDENKDRHKCAFMRTTIDLPDPLFREAKAVAALRDQSLKDVVISALKRELRDGRGAGGSRRRRSAAFPTLVCKGDFVVRPSREQLDDVV